MTGKLERVKTFLIDYSLYILIAIFLVVFVSLSPAFLSASNLLILIENASPLLLLSLGMAFVLLIGEIDLSVGSILCVGALLWGHCVSNWGLDMFLSTMIVLIVCGCLGAINALLITKLHIGSFLATLGTQIVISGMCYLVTDCVQINLSEEIRQITTRRVWDMISPVALIALFMVAVCVYLYTHTRFGRHIKATGTNRSAAKKIGINTTHIMMSSFIISGLMAGSAGIAHVYINSSALASKTGVGDEFTAITACVLGGVSLFGGVGSFFPGVMIGVLFLKLIENALNVVGTDPYLFSVIKGVIIFLAMFADSLKRSLRPSHE